VKGIKLILVGLNEFGKQFRPFFKDLGSRIEKFWEKKRRKRVRVCFYLPKTKVEQTCLREEAASSGLIFSSIATKIAWIQSLMEVL